MFFYKLIDVGSLRRRLPIGSSAQTHEVRTRAFSILHNSVMAVVLERLPKQDLETFARRYAANSSDPTLLDFLTERLGPNIEDDIRHAFQEVLEQLNPLLARIENEPFQSSPPNSEITAMGESLAALAIRLSQNVPQWVLDLEQVPPWLSLSLALVYLSFAKHWLPFLPVPEVARAVDKCMDDCFFEFVDHTNFELKVSQVIAHSSEQAAYCDWACISKEEFHKEHSDTHTVLTFLFANRCNQYAADLRAGILWVTEGKHSALGPVIFAYKRFNQHMWGVECDPRSNDLEEALKHLSPLNSLFMDGLEGTQRTFTEGMKTLPFTL